MKKIVLTSAATALLAACGADDASVDEPTLTASAPESTEMPMKEMDMGGMDHGSMMRSDMSMGMGEGRVVELDEEGDRVRIEHDAIEGVGMGAMTMFFEAKRGVDLAAIEVGDEVHFMLDQGRDGTYRIGAICDIEGEGHEACMASMHDLMPEGTHGNMDHER